MEPGYNTPANGRQITSSAFFDGLMPAFEAFDESAADKPHERANVECLNLLYHAIGRGEFDTALQRCTDDLVLEIFGPENIPFTGRWEGREEVLAAMRRNFSVVEEQQPRIESVIAQGDQIVVIAKETGRLRACQSCFEVAWVQWFTFRDGLVCHVREICDSGAKFPVGD